MALTLNSCSNKKVENDWTKDNLKGNVQSFKEFSMMLNKELWLKTSKN